MSRNPINSVLFVCLGNICRSAMAEGVLRAQLAMRGVDDIKVDSAGTSDWHIGQPPDARAVAAAAERGLDIAGLRARQIHQGDFEEFDLLAAMDGSNLAKMRASCARELHGKVRLYLDFARDLPVREVVDPYYGGEDDFDRVLDLLDVGAGALTDYITRSRS